MTSLQQILDEQYAAGRVPGAVALVRRGGETELATVGERSVGGPPMTSDSIFRIASITKPILAAATMVLVERGVLGLDDAVDGWLPELAEPMVLRDPSGSLDDVVPADRAISVRDLLTLRGGQGFTADVMSPLGTALQERLHQGPPRPELVPPPDEWMRRLGELPLAHQPGEGWTYNVGSDILGVLLARAAKTSLGELLHETVFEPLGMASTGFWTDEVGRLTSYYERGQDGFDSSTRPTGSGRRRLRSSRAPEVWSPQRTTGVRSGRCCSRVAGQVLSPESVRLMMTNQVEAEPDNPFLDGQGWGFGGGVDDRLKDPWNVPGRYGWVGGTGTAGLRDPVERHRRGVAVAGRALRLRGHGRDGGGADVRRTVGQDRC